VEEAMVHGLSALAHQLSETAAPCDYLM